MNKTKNQKPRKCEREEKKREEKSVEKSVGEVL